MLNLDEERRSQMVSEIQGFWLTEFDEELSGFRAEQLLDFLLGLVGAQIYNQAVQDARGWMLRKLEDLEGEVYEPESSR